MDSDFSFAFFFSFVQHLLKMCIHLYVFLLKSVSVNEVSDINPENKYIVLN